jgi:small subunit ribosomal protein S16
MGRKKTPHYRVVVTDRAAPREGRFVESIGYYKPLTEPARLVLDLDRVDYWIAQGAVPSDTVGSLIKRARTGGDDTLAVGEVSPEQEKAKKAEALAARRQKEVDEVKAKAAKAAEAAQATAAAQAAEAAEAAEAAATEEETPAAEEGTNAEAQGEG